ncbi:MAG: glycosyltransferase [Fibrobacterota bacterium]
MLLSVVIVNYNVKELLAQTVSSVKKAEGFEDAEIIVVDNNSQDNSREYITAEFPGVQWVGLKTNVGFGRGCNIGASIANAPYLLMLNPDTIVSSKTLTKGVAFFTNHPRAGIMGPKVLNQDGTFQWQCRRSFPTPLNAVSYFTGLYKLFPKNKTLSSYNMTWADTDTEMTVDAVSGSCFFIRKSLYDEVGGFDERFFMYGEDLDICAEVARRGYEVWYNPDIEIIHFKGKSSSQKKIAMRIAFYKAMLIFSEKYKKSYGTFFPTGFIALGISLKGVLHIFSLFMRHFTLILADFVSINTIYAAIILLMSSIRGIANYYQTNPMEMGALHGLLSLSLLSPFVANWYFKRGKHSFRLSLLCATLGVLCYLSGLFLLRNIAFSRLVLVPAGFFAAFFLVAERHLLPRVSRFFSNYIARNSSTIIVGDEDLIASVVSLLERQLNHPVIRGVVLVENPSHKAEVFGYPVVGAFSDIPTVLKRYAPDRMVIVSRKNWYSRFIHYLSQGYFKNLSILWTPVSRKGSPLGKLQEFSP